MTLTGHRPNPDIIPATNPAALAYIAKVELLGQTSPAPTHQLAYGPGCGQRLDVYAPPGASNLPILLFFHGGAWIHGHLGWLRFMAAPVLARGAILVAATYRLAPRHRWPAQLEDALAALDCAASNAEHWGGDPQRIAIGGHSAGGQLAAMAALHEPQRRLSACLPVSAPLDLRHGDVPFESEAGRVYRYLLARRSDDAAASPLLLADRARAPFHLVWGEHDIDHVARAGRAMAESLAPGPAAASFAILPGATHFDTHLSLRDAASPWYDHLDSAFSGARK